MLNSLEGEIWKVCFENYLISNFGRVFSTKTNEFLKQWPNRKGYMRVFLYVNGKKKAYFVHIQVVMSLGDKNGKKLPANETFIDKGLSIDHINRDKSDNSQQNLEIVTHVENCRRRDAAKGQKQIDINAELFG